MFKGVEARDAAKCPTMQDSPSAENYVPESALVQTPESRREGDKSWGLTVSITLQLQLWANVTQSLSSVSSGCHN